MFHQGQWLKVGWALSLLVVLSLLFVSVGAFNASPARTDEPEEVVVIRLKPPLGAKGLKGPDHAAALKAGSKVAQEKVISEVKDGGGTVLKTLWLANAVLAKVTPATKAKLASLPGVDRIHPNYTFSIPEPTIELKTADVAPLYHFIGDKTWGLDFLDIDGLWAGGYIGSGIRVAVLDTGVDIAHPALAGRMCGYTPGYYYSCWGEFDSYGNFVTSEPHDSSYHGTHVSGTAVGGLYDDGENFYHIGVAPEASLMHGLVLPDGSGTFTQVVAGMEWADDNGADVVNMSLGANGFYEVFIEPVQNLLYDGVIPVMAIGNDGSGSTGSPGNVYDAWAAGAVDEYHAIAYFSGGDTISTPGDWGSPSGTGDWPDTYIKPDFSAPGVDVWSALPLIYKDYGYGDPPFYWLSGTSMASPHLAGAVALLLQYGYDNSIFSLSAPGDWYDFMNLIYDCLRGTAMDHGAPGMDPRFGHGMVAADEAAACMTGGGPAGEPDIDVNPDAFDIVVDKGSQATRTLDIVNNGEATLNLTITDRYAAPPSSLSAKAEGSTEKRDLAGNPKGDKLGKSDVSPATTPAAGKKFEGDFLEIGISEYGELDWADQRPGGNGYGFRYKPADAYADYGGAYTSESLAMWWDGEGYVVSYGDKVVYTFPDVYSSGIVPVKQETVKDDADGAVHRVTVRTDDNKLRIVFTLRFNKHNKVVLLEAEFENISRDILPDVRYKRAFDWDATSGPSDDTGWDWIDEALLLKVDDATLSGYGADPSVAPKSFTYGVAPAFPSDQDKLYDRDLYAWDDYPYPDHGYYHIPDGPVDGDYFGALYFQVGDLKPGDKRTVTLVYGAGEGATPSESLEDLISRLPISGDVPWLTEDPTSAALTAPGAHDGEGAGAGLRPASHDLAVTVKVDARGLDVGEYDAQIVVKSDDPDESVIQIPVHVRVVVPVRTIIVDPNEPGVCPNIDSVLGSLSVDTLLLVTTLFCAPSDLVAITMLDTDQDLTTGYTGRPASDIGADYMAFAVVSDAGISGAALKAGLVTYEKLFPGLDISKRVRSKGHGFSSSHLYKFENTTHMWSYHGPGHVSPVGTGFSQVFWLATLVDDGVMDLTLAVGDFLGLTDLAPDTGHRSTLSSVDVKVSAYTAEFGGDKPLTGEEVKVGARVENLSDDLLRDVVVHFTVAPWLAWDTKGTDDPADDTPVLGTVESIEDVVITELIPGVPVVIDPIWMPEVRGKHWLSAKVDKLPREKNTSNNETGPLDGATGLRTYTDVVVGNDAKVVSVEALGEPKTEDGEYLTGVEYTLKAKVRNEGLLPMVDVGVSFIVNNSLVDTGVISLATDAEGDVEVSWTPEEVGTTIRAEIDPLPGEEDLDDNSFEIEVEVVKGYDVKVSALTVAPAKPFAGSPATVTATIENDGGLDVTDLEVLFSANGVLIGESGVSAKALVDIVAGGTADVSVAWTPDFVGSAELEAVIDTELAGDDPDDNSKSKNIKVSGHDVAVTKLEVKPAPKKGKASTISVTVKNQGTEKETFDVEVLVEGVLLSKVAVANLAGNATKVVAVKWTPLDKGSKTIMGRIEAGDVPGDVDLDDREKSLSVTVTAAPLKLAASSMLVSPKEASVTVQLRTPDGKADLAEAGIEVTLTASGGTLSASSVVTDSSGKVVVKVTPKGKSASFTVKAKALTASASAKGAFPKPKVSLKAGAVAGTAAEIEVSVAFAGVSAEGTVVTLTSTKGGVLSFTTVTLDASGKAKVRLVADKAGAKSTVTAKVDGVSSNVVVTFPK